MSPGRTPRRGARIARGFTLLEVLVTAFVLGTAMIAASSSMSLTARTRLAHAEVDNPAHFLAQEIHALAEGLPREPCGVTGATSHAQIEALDSLVGASFTPPILASGELADGFAGWSQQVDLSVYAMSDLSQPTADAPQDGLPADASKLYRLDVRVLQADEEVGAFSWWISP